MAKANRICYTCGQDYYHCPTCPSNKQKEMYYNMFHCKRCADIFNLLRDESGKKITTAQCKNELINLNVTLNENFKDGVKRHIERVFSSVETVNDAIKDDVVAKVADEITVEETLDTNIVIDSSVENISIEENLVSTHVSKGRKKKRNSEVD